MSRKIYFKILIIVLSISIIGGGFFAWRYFEGLRTKNKTVDWKTYQSEEYGFKFKYPSTWSIVADISEENSFLVFQSNNYQEKEAEDYKKAIEKGEETGLLQSTTMIEGIELVLSVTKIPSNYSWQDWARRDTDYPYAKQLEEKFLKDENNKEIMYERQMQNLQNQDIVVILDSFPIRKGTVLLESIFSTSIKDGEKNVETLRQIFSTFEFLDETANLQTYRNDEYGFEIKYPDAFEETNNGFLVNKDKDSNINSISIYVLGMRYLFDNIFNSFLELSTLTRRVPQEINNQIIKISKSIIADKRFLTYQNIGPRLNPSIITLIEIDPDSSDMIHIEINREKPLENYDPSKKNYTEFEELEKLNTEMLSTFKFLK